MPRTRALAVLVAAGAFALTGAGCSLGSDAFNENFPIDQPEAQPQQVVRTPTAVEPGQPFQDPPLIAPLPGPTGGVPGDTPESVEPFSPEGSEPPTTEE